MNNLSKKQVIDYICYNFGHIYSMFKDEIYKTFDKFTRNKLVKSVIRNI